MSHQLLGSRVAANERPDASHRSLATVNALKNISRTSTLATTSIDLLHNQICRGAVPAQLAEPGLSSSIAQTCPSEGAELLVATTTASRGYAGSIEK